MPQHAPTPRRHALGLFAAALVGPHAAWAQDAAYPSRPVRLLIPFPAGGAVDVPSRALAAALAPRLGQPVVVENRPGAGGNVAEEALARSAPDGYTLLVAQSGIMAVNRHIYPSLPYDPDRDLTPVSHLCDTLLVPTASPHRTIAELVAAGRAGGTPLTCGTSGNGTTDHLTLALFAERTGARIEHVPYRAGGTAVAADLMGGRLDMTIGNIPAYLGAIQGGRLRALAVTGAARWPALPEVPTMAEAGVPGVVVSGWTAASGAARPAGGGARPARSGGGGPFGRCRLPRAHRRHRRHAVGHRPGRPRGAGRAGDGALGRGGPARRHPRRLSARRAAVAGGGAAAGPDAENQRSSVVMICTRAAPITKAGRRRQWNPPGRRRRRATTLRGRAGRSPAPDIRPRGRRCPGRCGRERGGAPAHGSPFRVEPGRAGCDLHDTRV